MQISVDECRSVPMCVDQRRFRGALGFFLGFFLDSGDAQEAELLHFKNFNQVK